MFMTKETYSPTGNSIEICHQCFCLLVFGGKKKTQLPEEILQLTAKQIHTKTIKNNQVNELDMLISFALNVRVPNIEEGVWGSRTNIRLHV